MPAGQILKWACRTVERSDIVGDVAPEIVGLIGIGVLLFAMATKMYLAFAFFVVGFVAYLYLGGKNAALGQLALVPVGTAANVVWLAFPMFILMGQFVFQTGMAEDLYDTAYKWLGRIPGGLALATVGATAGFATVCGSSGATTATMGTVALPHMRRYKYDLGLATGLIAASGGLGLLIPPSTSMIVYGGLTEESIGALFMAGIIPGFLQAFFFMVVVLVLVARNPALAPRGESFSWSVRFKALGNIWGVLVLFILVIGGIYLGVFTPLEASAVGAFGALLFAVGRRRVTGKNFATTLVSTTRITIMVFSIIIGAMLFGRFLALSGTTTKLAAWIIELQVGPYGIIAAIIVMYIILGSFLEGAAMIVLTIPLVYPVIRALGFDGVWFGVMQVLFVEMGAITPPVGMNVFVLRAVADDVPMDTIFKGIVPFLLADFVLAAVLVAFPQLALWIPSTMRRIGM